MTAVIWCVQLILYPQFLEVDPQKFANWHESYSRRISLIVVPLMLAELISAVAVLGVFRNHNWRLWLFTGSVFTFLTWMVTFLVQVGQHARLSEGFSEATIHALVSYNWIRTFIWSTNSILLLGLLVTSHRPNHAQKTSLGSRVTR